MKRIALFVGLIILTSVIALAAAVIWVEWQLPSEMFAPRAQTLPYGANGK